jgi:hypothetical protein
MPVDRRRAAASVANTSGRYTARRARCCGSLRNTRSVTRFGFPWGLLPPLFGDSLELRGRLGPQMTKNVIKTLARHRGCHHGCPTLVRRKTRQPRRMRRQVVLNNESSEEQAEFVLAHLRVVSLASTRVRCKTPIAPHQRSTVQVLKGVITLHPCLVRTGARQLNTPHIPRHKNTI